MCVVNELLVFIVVIYLLNIKFYKYILLFFSVNLFKFGVGYLNLELKV